MDEFEFIKSLRCLSPNGVEGIGDDGALFADKYIIAKDIMASGVHFLKTAPIDLIIHKLFTSNVSDIAAMGGRGLWALLGVSVPKGFDLSALAEAIKKASEFYGLKLIGGDTTESVGEMFFSLTVIGRRGDNLLLRSGAKAGDILYLSRPTGLSKAALEKELDGADYPLEDFYHYKINAEIDVGAFLGSRNDVTSAADVSDGLGVDVGRIAAASNVKIIVDYNSLNFPVLQFLGDKSVDYALSSGEEFALIFTVKNQNQANFEKDFFKAFGIQPLKIGKVFDGSGCFAEKNGIVYDISNVGYRHF